MGYGFSRYLAVFVGAEFAAMGSDPDSLGAMGHFDVGARFHFANPARKWIPFFDVALTGLALSSPNGVQGCTPSGCITGDTEQSGAGWTLGGGVMYYAMPKFAVTGSLRWTVASFSHMTINGVELPDASLDATSTRLNLGFAWFPSR